MPATFFNLPGEIRNEIYKYLLVRPVPIDPYEAAEYSLGPQILATNSTAYNEAIHLLYSSNSFDLTRYKCDQWDFPLLEGFLDSIGLRNVSRLQNLHLNLPEVNYSMSEDQTEQGWHFNDVVIDPLSLHNMQLIQTYCTGLRTITIPIENSTDWERFVILYEQCEESVALVDSYFKAVESLERVVVEVAEVEEVTDYDPKVEDEYISGNMIKLENMRARMRGLGWVLVEAGVPLAEELRFTGEDDSDEEDLEYSEGGDELESESELAELLKEAEEITGKTKEVSDETELDISGLTI